jgi:hypothetical protein
MNQLYSIKYKLTGLFICLLFFLIPFLTRGQEWKVPDVKKLKRANFKFTPETVKKGEGIFKINCTSCHGIPGKSNFAVMTPSPGDPASDKFQIQTDGELFYKITNGRIPMPTFKDILIDQDRWSVISYFRSFNKSYIQPDTIPVKGFIDYNIELKIVKLPDSNKIKVTARAYTASDTTRIIVGGADISVLAERYFGMIQIGKTKQTNKLGEAVFAIPEDFPGDTTGNVNLVARLDDEVGSFGEGEAKITLKVGKITIPKSLTDTRAMWSVRSRAPYWVILCYCLPVLIVFAFIFYILNQLLKLRKFGIKSKKP